MAKTHESSLKRDVFKDEVAKLHGSSSKRDVFKDKVAKATWFILKKGLF
jgi:hypothetical protein